MHKRTFRFDLLQFSKLYFFREFTVPYVFLLFCFFLMFSKFLAFDSELLLLLILNLLGKNSYVVYHRIYMLYTNLV